MSRLKEVGIFGFVVFLLLPQNLAASSNQIVVKVDDGQRCFLTNGIPDHPTGDFPNRGNPNTISEQEIHVCVTTSPIKKQSITQIRGTLGIAINGVQFRPNTAGSWDPYSRRGHSRHGDRNWTIDIFGARGRLGLDFNNAHVGRGGLYHYHGVPTSLLKKSASSLLGYAGDGFEIHYVKDGKQSGWALKKGNRPSGPLGMYDGTYNEDYVYEGGEGKLDQCNGGNLRGKYVYFITDTYPFLPRCLYGEVSNDFNRSRHR
ncbi:MAG: YHYH protein [Rhodospirillaceae bacterium]|nr:YHYH protein [Rhodospirillaceae bacterium]